MNDESRRFTAALPRREYSPVALSRRAKTANDLYSVLEQMWHARKLLIPREFLVSPERPSCARISIGELPPCLGSHRNSKKSCWTAKSTRTPARKS